MTPLFISNFPQRCIIAPSNFCSTRNFYTIPVMPRSKSHLLTKIFLFQCTGIFISNHKTKNKTKLIKTKQKPKQIKKILVYLVCWQIRHWERKANFGPEWITTSCVVKIYPVIPYMTFEAIKLSSWKVSP